MGRIIFLLLVAAGAWAQTGVIEGVVVNTATQGPIAGATVTLHPSAVSGRRQTPLQTAVAGPKGEYRMEGVGVGEYRLEARCDGFLSMSHDHDAARPFALTAARPEVRLNPGLVPLAGISGRVLNPDNQPVAGIPVGLRQIWNDFWIMTTTTAKDGTFRLNILEPATWIVAALPKMRLQTANPANDPKPIAGPPAEDGQRMGWGTTFFPSTGELAGAEPIVLRPGAQLMGYDIKLRKVPVQRISGIIVDDEGKAAGEALLSLGDGSGKGIEGEMKKAGRDGRFEFDAVPGGDWLLYGQAKVRGQLLKGYLNVFVAGRDVTGLELRLTAPCRVTGFVEREQARDGEGKRKVTGVYLIPEGAPYDFKENGFHEQDGSFVIGQVHAARYRILPVGFVPGYYVASVWYGDQEATARAVDIADPPLPVRVVYKAGAARVSGTVEKGAEAYVAFLPQDEGLRDPHQFIRTTRCGADGKFSIDSLRPGGYYVMAFDRVRNEMLADVSFARRLTGQAMRLELRHGEAVTVELRPQRWPDY
ncbi:MAG: carboxypeptidase regulatory-like domain-containing protein [Bryobacterales bacterium]|nr:carboxypeptidase regulatory-like domain-containing protein [Bryobacterales bacterium]